MQLIYAKKNEKQSFEIRRPAAVSTFFFMLPQRCRCNRRRAADVMSIIFELPSLKRVKNTSPRPLSTDYRCSSANVGLTGSGMHDSSKNVHNVRLCHEKMIASRSLRAPSC